jgi:L-ascorbate metabolism protein UlaG (beta-lactamase superfamily)
MFEYKGVRLTWLGHDTFRIEDGPTIYTDPYQLPSGLKPADLVLITHDHFDHLSLDDLKPLVTADTTAVAANACVGALKKLPFKEVHGIAPGESIQVGEVSIKAVPAYNVNKFRAPGQPFHPKEANYVGFVVTVKGVSIYHAGDTDHIPEMRGLAPDIALIPVSGTYVMTAEEAVRAVADIAPKVAIPMHYGAIVGGPSDAQYFREHAPCQVVVLEKEV